MIVKFYRIIFGFLRIRFYGDLKERALTVCAQNGIAVWGTRLQNDGIECFISVKDFRYLKMVARGMGFRVHILKKYGVPFVTNRYKKRWGILIGVILIFTILEIMSGYIWIIDINGNEKIKDREILSACNSIGIKEGIRKNSIYPKVEREKLMLKLNGVAWASLNIEGSRLTVNITETKEKTDEKESYTNLKATADGIIEKMDIVSGTSVVKVGQAVKKGDLLVSGIMETADGTRFVKSKGTVIAKSQTELKFNEEFKQKTIIPTGDIKAKYVLELYGFKIPLYLGAEREEFKAKESIKTLKLFSSNLPIRIYKKRFEFQKEVVITYSYKKLCERLKKSLIKEEDISIVSTKYVPNETSVTLKALVEKTENIARSEKLLINAGN